MFNPEGRHPTTKRRFDDHSTEFGLWLREQLEIDSCLGYVTSNVDYIWRNYKTKQYMLIEEKRFGSCLKFPQSSLFEIVHKNLERDEHYCGFFLVQFSDKGPGDGGDTFIHEFYKPGSKKIKVTDQELIDFLRFKPLVEIEKGRMQQHQAKAQGGNYQATVQNNHDTTPCW